MTNSLGKNCPFCLLCVSFVNVYQLVCASFRFGFEGGVRDFVV